MNQLMIWNGTFPKYNTNNINANTNNAIAMRISRKRQLKYLIQCWNLNVQKKQVYLKIIFNRLNWLIQRTINNNVNINIQFKKHGIQRLLWVMNIKHVFVVFVVFFEYCFCILESLQVFRVGISTTRAVSVQGYKLVLYDFGLFYLYIWICSFVFIIT